MLKWIGRGVYYVAILVVTICGAYSYSVASKVTVRNISSPRAEFTIPYETHGGTVYISAQEDRVVSTLSKAVFAGTCAAIAVGLLVEKLREPR